MPDPILPFNHNQVGDYEHLSPSQAGLDRTGTSAFPTSIDAWPVFDDDVDEKFFAKYLHMLFCAIIAAQRYLQKFGAVAHTHSVIVVDMTADNTLNQQILVPVEEQELVRQGTFELLLRGRFAQKGVEWDENDPDHPTGIIFLQEAIAEENDEVEVRYRLNVA